MTAPAGAEPAQLEDAGGGRYLIRGALTLDTVTALRGAGLRAFGKGSGAIDVDLGQVTRADSGALALLIDWLAWARAAGRTMRVSAVPAALLALARLSDVEEFLTG
jgi:phospholipid transport system transporter-binding protein